MRASTKTGRRSRSLHSELKRLTPVDEAEAVGPLSQRDSQAEAQQFGIRPLLA
jgi:hypothetical protein